MKLSITAVPGSALLAPDPDGFEGDIPSIARELGRKLSVLVNASKAVKPRGTKGFSFHWSNAQARWDVISANDATWDLDGAEFVLYVRADAASPLNKPWSMKEMQYVAKALPSHPAFSRAMMASRVASRFLEASPDKMLEREVKTHGFELSALFSWDRIGGASYDEDADEGHTYDREEEWEFRDADLILYYGREEIGREQLSNEKSTLRFLDSLRGSKSVADAVTILSTVFRHDREFQKFLLGHPQLARKG